MRTVVWPVAAATAGVAVVEMGQAHTKDYYHYGLLVDGDESYETNPFGYNIGNPSVP